MFEAARIHDPIEHTFALAGFIAGAVLAAIIIIAAAVTVCTGGLGAIFLMALLASLAPSLPSIGEAIGKMFGSTAGMIITGARNVYTNKRKSALVSMSQVMCDKHSPQQLMAEGSPNVFIHRLAACRKDDRTTCDAKVSDGSGNVFIHGTPVQYLDIQSEVPDELRELVTKLLTYLEYATMILGLGALVKGLIKCVGGKLAGVFSKTAIKCVGKFATGIAAGVGGSMAGSAIGNAVTTSRVAGGQVGNPVEITTGRKILHPDAETDLVLNAPLPLAVARFYSSQLDASSMLGQGWRLPWESRLIQQPDHLLYLDEQGRDFKLPLLQAGERFAAPGEAFSLARLNDGRWVIADLHGTHWLFAASNPQRPEQLALSIIEDSLGHQIRHHYDDNGQLSAISDSVGNRLQLHYHSITLPSGPVIRLAALEQTAGGPGGVRVRYDYDEHARLTAVHDAQDNCQRRFAWGDDGPGRNLLIRHDNALGLSCHYRWDDFDGLPRVVEHSTSDGEHFHFTYDLPARSGSATNAAGHTVHWRWSEQLDILWCQDYDGAQYGFDYDALGQLTALRMPGHSEDTPRQWLLEYDELGRVVRETSPSGRSVSRSYCPDSLRVQTETDALGATWQYQYEPVTGVILRSTDPLGQQTTWHWENPFGPSAITDAKGNTTRYDWGPRGELLAYTDCSGKLTRYSYDSRGQLSSHSNALGETTLLHYDELGQLSQIQHPDGSREQFDYNALGQPLRHRNANGQLRHWRYTPRGLLHRYTDEGGHDTVAEYDALLQLCRLQHGQLEYRFAYAAGGRLEREQRPDQTSLQYRHAPGGELLERQRHGSDGQSVSRTRYQWDADGFLLEQAHEHASVAYAYDANGQLLSLARSPTAAGSALGIQPDRLDFAWDELGQLIRETGSSGELSRDYDALGNPLALTLPTGQRIDWLSYGSGHVHQLRIAGQLVSDLERDDLHREILRSQGRIQLHTLYDRRGRISNQRALQPGGSVQRERRYAWLPDGELGSDDHSHYGRRQYQYDPAGRLLRQTQQHGGSSETFEWDAADNLLSPPGYDHLRQQPLDGASTHGNRLLAWLLPRAGQRLRYDYDPFGRIIARHRDSLDGRTLHTQHFHWDADDRLLAIRDARGETRFAYDSIGRRIAKWHTPSHTQTGIAPQPLPANGNSDIPATATRFLWDGMRLIAELEPHLSRSYVYHPDQPYTPLARCDTPCSNGQAQAGGRLLWFHSNPLGTPEALADRDGTLVWQSRYRAWGELDEPQGGEHQPLRFPGQYHDSESGLHYNTFRYYDPESGRYLTPDPIGLAGGLHLYGYVPDPNGWMDPWGWCSKALGQNMEKAGIPRPKNTTPHHIAGDTGQAAQPGLAILKKHGIGVDDAANGVFLPNRGNTDLSTPGILHNGRHPNKYIEAVNKRLHKADVKGGKQAVLNELNAIRTELLNASRNAKWKDVL